MKKVLLAVLSLGIGVGVSAQKPVRISKELLNHAVEVSYKAPQQTKITTSEFIHTAAPALRTISELSIGQTVYDLQSNASLSNRVYQAPDGRKAAVWTMGMNMPTFPDRGTGYNYFDGTDWNEAPETRIEGERTGWPSYAKYKDGEIVVAHAGDDLILSKRAKFGEGDWIQGVVPAPEKTPLAWPRVVTSGDNNDVIHVIANSNDKEVNGQKRALLYYRSTDGGETWVDNAKILPGLTKADSCFEIPADRYYGAARGNNVAFVVYSMFHTDLMLLKSADNGQTWEKTVIWKNKFKSEDLNPLTFDTCYVPATGDCAVDIDDNGNAHVVFSLSRIIKKEAGDTFSYFPLVSGIAYWKEGQGPFAGADYNNVLNPQVLDEKGLLVGYTPDLDGDNSLMGLKDKYIVYPQSMGCSNFPSIACVKGSNDLVLTWCDLNELADDGTHCFRHIFAKSCKDGKWDDNILHVTNGEENMFSECLWPQLFNVYNGDDKVYIFYMKDDVIGLSNTADPQNPSYNDNSMQVIAIDKSDLNLEVSTNDLEAFTFSVKQNFPNPVSGITTIEFSMEESATVKVQVLNLIGQEVFAENKGRMQAGTHQTKIDATTFETGVYFYNVTVGEKTVTKKMIVK